MNAKKVKNILSKACLSGPKVAKSKKVMRTLDSAGRDSVNESSSTLSTLESSQYSSLQKQCIREFEKLPGVDIDRYSEFPISDCVFKAKLELDYLMYDFDPSFEDNPKEAEITRKKNVKLIQSFINKWSSKRESKG